MSKLSDSGLIILVISTIVIIVSIFILQIIPTYTFILIQIIGWLLFIIGLIIGAITKDDYHVIILKTGFPLKLDHLVILSCALALSTSSLILLDILNFIYTGELTFFALIWITLILVLTLILYLLIRQKLKGK